MVSGQSSASAAGFCQRLSGAEPSLFPDGNHVLRVIAAVADVSDEEEGPKASSLVETRDKKKVPDSDDEDTPIVHWID